MDLKKADTRGAAPSWSNYALAIGVLLTAIYGGYFGAAQGVILMGLLTVLLRDLIQELNGLQNVVVGLNNLVAALILVATAHVAWEAAGLIATSSIVGGQAGSAIGRGLNPLV